jgi:hypothetical protein
MILQAGEFRFADYHAFPPMVNHRLFLPESLLIVFVPLYLYIKVNAFALGICF